MCPAIASGIVTEDVLVSYWPMLLAIITICTRAQLHSKTLGSLSNSVVERRTSTGSGLFASLGSVLVETLG